MLAVFHPPIFISTDSGMPGSQTPRRSELTGINLDPGNYVAPEIIFIAYKLENAPSPIGFRMICGSALFIGATYPILCATKITVRMGIRKLPFS